MKLGNTQWIKADVKACIEPPPITMISSVTEKVEECNIIKINMRRDPASSTSKTYKLKVPTSKNGKPEEFLQIMKEFKTATDGTVTTPATVKNHFLRTMLHGYALR